MKFLFLRTWLTEFKIPKRVGKKKRANPLTEFKIPKRVEKKKRANPPLEFRVSKFL